MIECPICGSTNIEQAQRCGKCASPLLDTDLRCGLYTYGGTSIGQVLQMRYIINRELSSDVTGVKYLAEDAEEKKDVMIWALPVIASEDEEKIQSLCELCNRLAVLTDEHISNVFGCYAKNNARYLVTEYVDGCSLEERIASVGPLNPEETLEIFGPLAQCLDHAHKQGFIHGDISPANILISSKGIVKLANFAIGKAIKDMLALVSLEEDIKPSFYTAPEQLETAACSAKGDIYSLAACISQSLCKKSDKQNEVLRKSLSANPHDRHNSAAELLTELRDSAAEMVAVENQAGPEQIGYEKSLADLKQKTRQWSRELEEAINTLTADAEREKQKHAEILHQTQTQARQQLEQQRTDYEGKIEQLKTKIEQAQAELAAALSEVDRKTEALVTEKEKALQQSREHEETINKLIADAEREKQKYAEMISRAQAQLREQAQQQLAEYEEKIIQLKAKIADSELAAVAALGQPEHNTEALAAEKEKALQQSREHEEAIINLIANAEKEKQQHLEILSQTQTQVRQQAKRQLADYEEQINRLKAGIAEAQAKLAAAVSDADRKAMELAAEKEKALQQSREYEEVIKKLTADIEKEKQLLAEASSNAQTQPIEQTEPRQADYEAKIKQLEARTAEMEAKLATAVSEANQRTEALAAEKEKVLQRCREYEETIKKVVAGAEKEKQQHLEILNQAEKQAREQTEQLRADYEKKIEQHKDTIADAQYAAAINEAEHKARELAAEKEKALQQSREYEDVIKKLTADAEKEKQILAEALSRAQTLAREQAEQQRADSERKINQFKAKIAETEAKLANAMSEAHRNTVALVAEKKKALQQSREHEETLERVSAEARQQQKKSAEQLHRAQREIERLPSSKPKFLITGLVLVSIVICGAIASYLYMRAQKQYTHSLKQGMNSLSPTKQIVQETPAKPTAPALQNDVVKKKPEKTVPQRTFSELTKEAVGFEANDEWEKAIALYEKALEINKIPRIENRVRLCWYNLYLSQATAAQQADDLDKAVELYNKALTYNDTPNGREKLESARKTQGISAQIKQMKIDPQKWLETAY